MPPPDLISATTKITALARSGLISAAHKLFNEMPQRDTIAYNAMLTAYASSNLPQNSLALFSSMLVSDIDPDHFTFTAVLSAAAALRNLKLGTKLHALALRFGLISLPVANSIVDMYGKCARAFDARRAFDEIESHNEVSWCSLIHAYITSRMLRKAYQAFDEMPMPVKNVVTWNVMIMGCVLCDEPAMGLVLFKKMRVLGFEGDALTFSGLMNACAELEERCFGCMIHTVTMQIGWISAVEVSNSILSFYAEFGCMRDARKIFEGTRMHSQVSWNAMVDAYMKAGDVDEAISLFTRAPKTNIISWTSMIAGFAKNGHGEDALLTFAKMKKNFYKPDDLTFSAVVHASASLAIVSYGKMIHSCVIQRGFASFGYVANGLVNMYAKCGDIESSSKVFNGMHKKDLVAWNAMILGFALHGLASKALETYKEMVACKVVPDKVTNLGLLMACSHSGLIDEAKDLINTMQSLDTDHLNCAINMIARAGHVKEACELIQGEVLLNACSVSGNIRAGMKIGEELVRAEPERECGYLMLSNLYCVSGQWEEAERVRREMVEKGVKKEPGCSWIEVRDFVKVFMSGIRSLDQMIDVHEMLCCLHSEMRNQSCIAYNIMYRSE